MLTKVYLEFANSKIRACDHIYALDQAVRNASMNLKQKHNIDIELESIGKYVFIWVNTNDDEVINYGNHLRGISRYLLKHDWADINFSDYLVGNRLLNYYPETKFQPYADSLTQKDRINTVEILKDLHLLRNVLDRLIEYVDRNIEIKKEVKI